MRFRYDAVALLQYRNGLFSSIATTPFLTLTLDLQHDRGPTRLKLGGEGSVMGFLRAELGISAETVSLNVWRMIWI